MSTPTPKFPRASLDQDVVTIAPKLFNDIMDALEAAGKTTVGRGLTVSSNVWGKSINNTLHIKKQFPAKIVNQGPTGISECDSPIGQFDDHKYWVQSLTQQQQDCEVFFSASTYVANQNDATFNGGIYKVENMQECFSKTHFLQDGEIVWVTELGPSTLASTSGTAQYIFPKHVINVAPKDMLAKIVATGPCGTEMDFTTNQYWCKRQDITNTDTNQQTALTTGDVPNIAPITPPCDPCASSDTDCSGPYSDNRHLVVVATNWGEAETSHGLPTDGSQIVNLQWMPDANGYPRYSFTFGAQSASIWCPVSNEDTDCADNTPTITPFAGAITNTSYLNDDYRLQQQIDPDTEEECNPGTLLVENKYNTFLQFNYFADPSPAFLTPICDTKIIQLYDQSSVNTGSPPPALSTYIPPNTDGVTYNKYSGYFTMSSINIADLCSCWTVDGVGAYLRNGVKLQVDTYIDPCSFLTSIYDCDGTLKGETNKIKFGSGLAVANVGTITCGTEAIVNLNMNITSDDDSISITPSTDSCEDLWDLSVNVCNFLPTITDGVTTTKVGTVTIGSGLTLVQNTADCPGAVTLTASGGGGGYCGSTFYVNLTNDGGSDGGQTYANTYTYTAVDVCASPNTVGTTLTPLYQRPYGSFVVATHGIGYWTDPVAHTGFVLVSCDEVPNTVAGCS